jgi:MFS transporter, DHA1 family, inner membrane transport protein
MQTLQSRQKYKPSNRLPTALLALSASAFAIGTTEFTPIGLLPSIASDLSISIAHAGLLVSGYALGVTFAAPILTALLQHIPRKPLLIGLMVLFIITNLSAAVAPGFELLVCIRFITAFTHGVFYAVGATVAASLVRPERQASAISIMFAGITIAMAFSVPLATFVGQRFGWRITFIGIALMGVVAASGIQLLIPSIPPFRSGSSAWQQFRVLAEPKLVLTLAITTIGWAGAFVPFTYLAAILENVTGFQPTIVSGLLILFGIAVAIGNLAGGKAADIKPERSIVAIFALQILVFMIFGFAMRSQVLAVPTVIALGLLQLSTGPGLQLLVVRIGQLLNAEGICSGLNQSAFNLGIALGALIGGWVVDSPWGLGGTPWVGATLVSIALILTQRGLRRHLAAGSRQ